MVNFANKTVLVFIPDLQCPMVSLLFCMAIKNPQKRNVIYYCLLFVWLSLAYPKSNS